MTLTHRPSKIIQQLIVDLSLGTLPSADSTWPVFPDTEPDLPDNCITVYNTEPDLLGTDMLTAGQVEREGIQVRVRDQSRNADKARSIANILERNGSGSTVTVGSSTYTVRMVLRNSGPIYLGKDKPNSNRFLYTINYFIDVEENS